MLELLTSQTAKVVFDKEVEFPREFGVVKSQTAGNRPHLIGLFGGLLHARNQTNRLRFALFAFFFGQGFVEVAQLQVPKLLSTNDATAAVDRIGVRDGAVSR